MGHGHDHAQRHLDPNGETRGLRAIRISIVGLLLTGAFQMGVVALGGSAALFADALHNLGDVFTTVALWAAFLLSRRAANRRFTYSYHRAEDLMGIVILLIILLSAGLAGWESYQKLSSGNVATHLPLGMLAALVGLVGNEIVAQYKIKVGREINSVGLVADGQHSRVDGLTSLAAFVGLVGVALGVPAADPVAGLVITAAILYVAGAMAVSIVSRLMDGVEPALLARIEELADGAPGVQDVRDVRARWAGRSLFISLVVCVDPELTIREAHAIAEEVRHELFHHLDGASQIDVHVDPFASEPGGYHELTAHHGQLGDRSS